MSSNWLSLEAALQKALDATPIVTDKETVPLSQASGRIAASDIYAILSPRMLRARELAQGRYGLSAKPVVTFEPLNPSCANPQRCVS